MNREAGAILAEYRALLAEVDDWFARCGTFAGDRLRCAGGCAGCCRGLFDITLLDAFLLQSGLRALGPADRDAVAARTQERLHLLQARWTEFRPPFLLTGRLEEERERLHAADETPCPLLSAEGRCLLYPFRPLTCRLHGLPLVDLSGDILEPEGCTLNFPGEDPLLLRELRWDVRKLFVREAALIREFNLRLTGAADPDLDTVIPAAFSIDIAAFGRHLP